MIRVDWLELVLLMAASGGIGFIFGMVFGWNVRDRDATIDRLLNAPEVDPQRFEPRRRIFGAVPTKLFRGMDGRN
jgi:hypothetical protein